MSKKLGMIILGVGAGILLIGIFLGIFSLVYEPKMDGDPSSEFKMNDTTGELSQNGVGLSSGDKIHIYGRVTEYGEDAPLPGVGTTTTYLALGHDLAILIPNDILKDLDNEDHISVKGEIRSYLGIEYVLAESYEKNSVNIMAICYSGCGVTALGVVLGIVGLVLIGIGAGKAKAASSAPAPGQQAGTQGPSYDTNYSPPDQYSTQDLYGSGSQGQTEFDRQRRT